MPIWPAIGPRFLGVYMAFIHVRHKQVYAGINNSYALALANDLLTIAV
jgi:hypothetical protein